MLSITREVTFASSSAFGFEFSRPSKKRRQKTTLVQTGISSLKDRMESLSFSKPDAKSFPSKVVKFGVGSISELLGKALKPRRIGAVTLGLATSNVAFTLLLASGGGNSGDNYGLDGGGGGGGGGGDGGGFTKVFAAYAEESDEDEEEDEEEEEEEDEEEDEEDEEEEEDMVRRKRKKTSNKDDFIVESVLATNLPTGPGIPSKVRPFLFFQAFLTVFFSS